MWSKKVFGLKLVQRMVTFIEMEGDEKARAIDEKAEEEYNLTKGSLLYNGRRELQELYDKRYKAAQKNVTQMESAIYNKANMVVQSARQSFITDVTNDIHAGLKEYTRDPKYLMFLKSLMHQALHILKEPNVIVQVREEDHTWAESAIAEILRKYRKSTGLDCLLTLSKKPLDKDCIGGVVMYNKRCSVKVSNTLSDRLRIVLEKSLPIFREFLFNESPKMKDGSHRGKHQKRKLSIS